MTDFSVSPPPPPTNTGQQVASTGCYCWSCNRSRTHSSGLPYTATVMIVCPDCGNKRCGKATHHGMQCSNSNEPGQPGSRYA